MTRNGFVVIGFDGSDSAWTAAEYGAAEAVSRGLSVRLVHAMLDPAAYSDTALARPVQDAPTEARRLVNFARNYLRTEFRKLDVDVYIAARDAGALLVDAAQDADLLVVGRRGRGGVAAHLGSVSGYVTSHAGCPVAVVGQEPVRPDGPVVVGIDATHPAPDAIAFAFDTAERNGAELRACYVWTHHRDWPPGPMTPIRSSYKEDEEQSRRLLSEALAGWRSAYPEVPVTVDVVHGMDPPARLLDAAESASLVVVGSRKRTGVRLFVLGSVGQALVHNAHCPVVVVRSAPTRGRAPKEAQVNG